MERREREKERERRKRKISNKHPDDVSQRPRKARVNQPKLTEVKK
jgi:hypothetical protein